MSKVPQPGPAKLARDADLDAWLDAAKRNKYLPERVMKQLFEMCKELLMEGEFKMSCITSLVSTTHLQSRVQCPTCFYTGDDCR